MRHVQRDAVVVGQFLARLDVADRLDQHAILAAVALLVLLDQRLAVGIAAVVDPARGVALAVGVDQVVVFEREQERVAGFAAIAVELVALVGAGLVATSFTALDWLKRKDSTFTDIHNRFAGIHPWFSGFTQAYFSWLGWLLLGVVLAVALAANLPVPTLAVLRPIGFLLALVSIGLTFWAIKFTSSVRPTYFDYLRLPELFCGFSRDFERYSSPVSYPVSCSPQAWAAGTTPHLLQTLLGLEADAANRQLRIRPYLPDWLEEVHVRGMRFAGEVVNLHIRGHHHDQDVQFECEGDVTLHVDDTQD